MRSHWYNTFWYNVFRYNAFRYNAFWLELQINHVIIAINAINFGSRLIFLIAKKKKKFKKINKINNTKLTIFVSSDLSWLCIDIVHVVSTIESRDEAN